MADDRQTQTTQQTERQHYFFQIQGYLHGYDDSLLDIKMMSNCAILPNCQKIDNR